MGNGGRGLGGQAMENVPLWMTEGQSEYLSTRRTDAHMVMWIRDAVKHNDIHTLEDMTLRMHEYFFYRWGHAFWAFIAVMNGDAMVHPMYIATAEAGYRSAIDPLTGLNCPESRITRNIFLHKITDIFKRNKNESLNNIFPYRRSPIQFLAFTNASSQGVISSV
jgi:hypothetical protein